MMKRKGQIRHAGVQRFFHAAKPLACAAYLCLCLCCTGGPRTNVKKDAGPVTPPGIQEINPAYLVGPGDILELTLLTLPGASTELYRLQVGDTLLMEFHRNEHLNRNLYIRPDGMVTVPYAGEVKAAGSTVGALALELRKKLGAYFVRPEITLSVIGYNSYLKELKSTISNSNFGQVKRLLVEPDGALCPPLLPRLQVAGRSTAWIENELRERYGPVLGNVAAHVDLTEARSNSAYVLGEVNNQGPVYMTMPMTVTQVLAMAGGYTKTAGLASVVLIRPDENNQPTARLIDVADILKNGTIGADERVRRYDVIYVPPSLIAKLNDAILYGIRNMMPLQSNLTAGYTYLRQHDTYGSNQYGTE